MRHLLKDYRKPRDVNRDVGVVEAAAVTTTTMVAWRMVTVLEPTSRVSPNPPLTPTIVRSVATIISEPLPSNRIFH